MSFATPSTLRLIVASSLLHSAYAQTEGTVSNGQNSKVAITGAVIGGVLLIIALLAVAVYGIERCIARRRAAKTGGTFTPLPTTQSKEDSEPYRYLMSPPATPPAKNKQWTLTSPGGNNTTFTSGPVDFDPYDAYRGPVNGFPSPRPSPMPQSPTPSLPNTESTVFAPPEAPSSRQATRP
ncbi:hypothetical protein MSAN_00106400 [Mycena sanguinolenta]|uniref:Uncharacterized protein n=1 Tax=Mycena sanguinolenta TaxID=230812 RepID=A0A8H7DKM9_9AGAR|nr:hypothetical protein MSAN_00106400 [Mycena sanguinolenta]